MSIGELKRETNKESELEETNSLFDDVHHVADIWTTTDAFRFNDEILAGMRTTVPAICGETISLTDHGPGIFDEGREGWNKSHCELCRKPICVLCRLLGSGRYFDLYA